MRVNRGVGCGGFPCDDVRHDCYVVPDIDIEPASVSIILISESAPASPADYCYANGSPLFQQTTVQAFRDAGADVNTMREILGMGSYLVTVVKCGKTWSKYNRIYG